ncbi:WecB/TagA/CpsF family glycosyltransferase [Pediococcus ethanolidurans]|uniref:WecB/TagA/CpsF family glycosyltransferase n=1 Tax=Pediococcus ethanolidurans TaxID=319653 RepID=UPI0021E6F6DB|nr:WecB/TagA/CpsF family glycosyltransferase [Pediococcus ethanolidurans]MCV3314526.1 WecB/TagA/CpsF family glycosyltransferase [Pediococcus ethanolidurans]
MKNGVYFLKKVKIFDVEFDALSMKETVQLVEQRIASKKGTHLLGVNADKINEIDSDPEMKRIVSEADIINADGASVVLASHVLKQPLPERVAGIDLMQELLKASNTQGYTVYFLGAKESVVSGMVSILKKKYKDLKVIGYRNGYFSKDKWKNIADKLIILKPDIVFIGITSPTKEYLIDYFLSKKIHTVFMGVGGSFDVLSGNVKRAPKLMQRLNLEWIYRVAQEPRRLFKRYFFGNMRFFCRTLKEFHKLNRKF